MAVERDGFRDVVGALFDRFGKNSINRKELAEYLGVCEKTAGRIIQRHKIPRICGVMEIRMVAKALSKGD